MLEAIKFLGNIGAFEAVRDGANLPLGHVTLIYGENGRGKTTLAAVLRSLATGDSAPINERRRLDANKPPKAVIRLTGKGNAVFADGAWNVKSLNTLKIFDDQFVATNVCSGLEVYSEHRKNLHELILGEPGVELNRTIQLAAQQVIEHRAELGKRADAIRRVVSPQIGASLTSPRDIKDFCRIERRDDIEEALQEQDRLLTVADSAGDIRQRPEIDELSLPTFEPEAVDQLLRRNLDDLDADAVQRITDHAGHLGRGGEQWLNQGVVYAEATQVPDTCPFCTQDLSGSSVIAHYRRYFSNEYRSLRETVSQRSRDINAAHSNDVQVEFERTVTRVVDGQRFWSRFCDVDPFQIDAPTIVAAWTKARDKVVARLRAKVAAPLETLALGQDALDAIAQYMSLKRSCDATNLKIRQANRSIKAVKDETNVANREAIHTQIAKLKRVKERHSPTVAEACDTYTAEEVALAETEAVREKAKKELEEYRKSAFSAAEQGLNRYMDRFGVGFRISDLSPRDSRGGPTSGYDLELKGGFVQVRSEDTPSGEHSFGNTLSAGDRNALALAFFLDAIERNENIGDLIVVLDDPVSSLDDHRRSVTVEEIKALADKVQQVIVLSHSTRLLCDIWNNVTRLDRASASTIEIVRSGSGSSVAAWDIEDALREQHDKRHQMFTEFVETGVGDPEAIAEALRDHIERFLRVAFPAEFPRKGQLGPFIDQCRQVVNSEHMILAQNKIDDLSHIVNYAKQFKHDAGDRQARAEINDLELLTYTKRVLAFTRPR